MTAKGRHERAGELFRIWTLAVLLTIAVVALELLEVRARAGAGPGGPQLGAIALLVGGHALGLILAAGTCGWLLGAFVGPRLGRHHDLVRRGSSLAASVAAAMWLCAESAIHRISGNHLGFYLSFVEEPEFLHWAGGLSGIVESLGPQILQTIALGLGALIAFVALDSRGFTARGRRALIAALAGSLLLVAAGFPLQQMALDRVAAEELRDQLPLPWNVRPRPDVIRLSAEARATAVYAELFEQLGNPRPFQVPAAQPRTRPNVVLIVLESLRADAFNSELMPALWAWSEKGARLRRHYSSSNASLGGYFALVTGWYPLYFDQRIQRGDPPSWRCS